MRLLILNVFLFLFYTNTRCQDTIINHTNKWIASANFGSSIYYGDLKKSSNPFWTNKYDRQWAYGIKLGRELNSTISVYGQLNKGNVGSSFGAQKFAYFKANYLQYFIGGDVNLLNLLLNNSSSKFTINGNLGIGFIDFRTIKKDLNNDTYLASFRRNTDGTKEGKAVTETIIPIGIGIGYKINENFSICLNYTFTFVNSDKIDATIAKKRDDLSYLNISLKYRIGKTKVKNEIAKDVVKPIVSVKKDSTTTKAKTEEAKVEIKETAINTTKVDSNKNIINKTSSQRNNLKAEKSEIKNDSIYNTSIEGLNYRIQVLALLKKKPQEDEIAKKLNLKEKVYREKTTIWNQYTVGNFKTINLANDYKIKLSKEKGLRNLFIVAYYNNKRITISEAKDLIKRKK